MISDGRNSQGDGAEGAASEEQTTSQASQEELSGWCSRKCFEQLPNVSQQIRSNTSTPLTVPCIVPVETLNVDQNPLKLWDGQSWVSIVKLDSYLVRELFPRALALLEAANDIIERGSAPEVLLLETKLLTTLEVVVGVQNSGNSLSTLLVRYRALVFARVELLEIEFAAGSLAAPEAEVVACAGLITRNWDIISHSLDNLATLPRRLLLALVILPAVYVTVELDVDCDVVPLELPRVKVEPVVWDLDLVSVNDLLFEDTVSVSKTLAPSRVV